jgi:hypothetical protein
MIDMEQLILKYSILYELFYDDWHGIRVPSGTVKPDFLEPLIKTLYYMVPCFDVRYNAQVLLYEKNKSTTSRLAVLTPDRDV